MSMVEVARPPKLMSSAVEAPVPMFMVSAPVPVPKFRVRVKDPPAPRLNVVAAGGPKVTSVVSEKGERTPEFNCHLLPPEPPEQLPVVRQTVPVSSGKVNVRSAVKSAVVIVPVKKAAPELLGERLKESALATLESKVNRESVSTLKRKSPAPPTV